MGRLIPLDLGSYSFDQAVKVIKSCANSGSAAPELNEDMIKAGLHRYMRNHQDFAETGLQIAESEVQITPESRPDFVGIDGKGQKVLIECKGTANASACDQLLRYKGDYGGKPRLLLVAFSFDNECRKQAKKNGVQLIECRLTPKRL